MTIQASSPPSAKRERVDSAVDVAVPVYRRATFVADAIESVLAQSFERWHLTICDNGPGGGDIERAVGPYLSDPRVSYSPTGEELSVGQNWTAAINHGTRPYVALLHDDDRWHSNFLKARVEVLESHRECGFAFGEYVHIDGRGVEIARTPARFPEGPLSRAILTHWLARECIVAPPTILVRRSALETVGARFSDDWLYCDWEMWARLAAHFPAYYLARHDSDFRRHLATQTLATPQSPTRLVAMLDEIEALFRAKIAGFEVSRLEGARNRSRILLRAAESVHPGGGWKVSRRLYLRSLRLYPPTFVRYTSLRMVIRSVLGERLSDVVAGTLRLFWREGLRANRR